jgi:hypothetical protein
MAGELKPMLAKVLTSGGEKKYFFAYGTGKRKDGNGEGDLAVRATKPKKPEIEAALAPCKEFFEGFCWTGHGPDDSKTVYFQSRGKPLSSTLVTKMKLTAKTTLGRQYDFQIASPEEAARADKLADSPSESDGGTNLASGDQEQEPEEEQENDAGGQEANADEARWNARREAIESDYLAALEKQPPNASQLRAVLGFADGKAEAGDFAKALLGLDSLEKLLQATPQTADAAVLHDWQVACADVKSLLRKVQAELVKAKDVNSTEATLRLESIIKNLASDPSTQQDVAELDRWIREDDVITRVQKRNPWGIEVTVRQTLLPVLDTLKAKLPD